MQNPHKQSTNNPLLNSPFTNGHQTTPKKDEQKSSGGVNSLKRLDAMREECARIAKEKQEEKDALLDVHHCKCSHANPGECSS